VIDARAIDPGREAFEAGVAALLAARDTGAFLPRCASPIATRRRRRAAAASCARVPARRQRRAHADRGVGRGRSAGRPRSSAPRSRLAAAGGRSVSAPMLDPRADDARSRQLAQTEFARPVAIEAGAGTGKTAILVARVLAWCLGPGWERVLARDPAADPLRVAERVLRGVVAITFTEAAAAEMDERIEQALAALERGERPVGFAMSAPPDRVAALRGALDQLVVETIHAYCRRVLAAHPIEAGLHPLFEVDADGAFAAEAVREAVSAQLGAAYGRGDEAVLELARHGIGPFELEAELLAQRGAGVEAAEIARDPLAPERIEALRARLAAAHEALEVAAADRLPSVSKGKAASAVAAALRSARPLLGAPARTREELTRLALGVVAAWQGTAGNALPKWAKGTFSQAEQDVFAERRAEISAAAARLDPLLAHLDKLDSEVLALLAPTLASLAADAEERLAARDA
jgi:ATP-dependent exoDNAse (exonuclease V) beta subunit